MNVERERIFSEVAQAILAHLDLEEVLKGILEKALEFFESDAASLLLFDERKEFLRISASIGLDPDYVKIVKVGKDEQISGKVVQERKARVITDMTDVFREIGDDFSYEKIKGEGLVSLICAPVQTVKEGLGTLNIYFRTEHAFEEEEVNTINLFCDLIAIALENARLHKRTADRLENIVELSEIGRSINSLRTTDEIIDSLLRTSVSLINAQGASIMMLKNGGTDVDRAYSLTKSGRAIEQNRTSGLISGDLISHIAASRKPVAVSDTAASKWFPADAGGEWRSVFGLPLKIKERIIGILFVNDNVVRDFTEKEASLLAFLANESAVAIENARLNENVERRMKELSILYEIGQGLISTLELDVLFANTLQRLKDTMGYVNCAILFVDEERQELYFRSSFGYPHEVTKMRIKIGHGLTGAAVQSRQLVYVPDVSVEPRYVSGMKETRSELSVPLEVGRKVIGVLDVESPVINGFSDWEINLFKSISAQLSIAVEKSMLYEETRSLSLTDPLTETANRRHFNIILDSEIKRSERYGRPLSLIIIDLDHFKEYNDRYGHPAGDTVLKEFTRMMYREIRDIDFMARYGGDEFIIVLPETDVMFAKLVGERIRQKIESNPIDPNVTVSLGIASFPKDARDRDSLVESADRALYIAKQLGGNRIALVD